MRKSITVTGTMVGILARFLLVLVLGVSLVQASDDQAALDEMTRWLKLRLQTDAVETPVPTQIEGVYEVRYGGRIAYLVENGRYVFIGDLVDLEQARNLTELSRREAIVDALAEYGDDRIIVYPADGDERAVLNVFTDTSCTYCQRLHNDLRHLRAAGISVRYYPFPRGGSRGPGYSDLRKVWCADDPRGAMDIAKGSQPGQLDGPSDCAEARYVDDGYELGRRIGVMATPALYTADGAYFERGYVPHRELIPLLLNP